jgi:dienelactone hydrolase
MQERYKMANTKPTESSEKVNSDPIVFMKEMVKRHRPKLAAPKSGTGQEYIDWTNCVKQKLPEILGLNFMQATPLKTSTVETKVQDGILRERFFLETESGYWAPVIVNVPEGKGPFPVVLCPHGHTLGGKEGVSGLVPDDSDENLDVIVKQLEIFKDTYAADLARKGYLTVSVDNRSFNQARHPQPYTYNDYSWHLAELAWHNALGRSIIGSMVWDSLKVLDYVLQRNDVDADRVGCIGFSLGGMLSLYISLLEPRIKATVISGYFDCYLGRILRAHGADCLCNYIPGLYAWFDVPDLTAALAPRPVLCNNESSKTDEPADKNIHHITFEKVKKVYQAIGADDKCELFLFESSCHTFSGVRAYPWLDQYLM